MRTIRRHWPVVLTVFVIALLGFSTWFLRPAAWAEGGGGDPTPVTEVQWFAMNGTFREAGLSTANVSALNVTASQAQNILSAAREWYGDNATTIAQRYANRGAKGTAVRVLETQVAAGPRSQATLNALATARQELATAHTQYAQTLQGLVTAVNELLSESQRATWAVLRGNDRQLPDRLLALSSAQERTLSRLRQIYRQQLAEADTVVQRNSARESYATARSAVLTTDQRQMITAYGGYAADAAGNALDAWDDQLPRDEA